MNTSLIYKGFLNLFLGTAFVFLAPTTYAATAEVLYQNCKSAAKVFKMSDREIRKLPVEEVVQARECVEFLQGFHGGMTFNNLAIVMQNPDVSAKVLAKTPGVCLPSTTNRELVMDVLNFMDNNKDKLHLSRELIAGHALRAAYPPEKYCTTKYYQKLRDLNK